MKYIWEVKQYADNHLPAGHNSIRYIPTATADPYREVCTTHFNLDALASRDIEINLYYRFADILEPLLQHEMLADKPEMKAVLFDVLLHILANREVMDGFTRDEFYYRFVEKEIACGAFGERYRVALSTLGPIEKSYFLAAVLASYRTGASLQLFRDTITSILPKAFVYVDSEYSKELLIYIPKEEAEPYISQLALLVDFLVPLDYTVHVFWNQHFGIVGIDETMQIGEITIF